MTAPRVFVIAEAGVNHNGDLPRALAMVEAAHAAGADAVKFQTFDPASLVTRAAPKARYQAANTGEDGGQLAMLQALALPRDAHFVLAQRCCELGIEFMSTPFDLGSLEFLVRDLGLARIKLSSGDLDNGPLLLAAAATGKPLILSTGMGSLAEVEAALGVLAFGYATPDGLPGAAAFAAAAASAQGHSALRDKLTLLHCTTEYPAPFEDVNLRAMDTLRAAFGVAVGLSDHTPGIAVPMAAAARGAAVVEKHFTLDRGLPGPDQRASLEPGELGAMVLAIRQVEHALGDGTKLPAACELGNREVARRSLVALAPIRAGEPFTPANLGAKRPGGGVSPMRYWELLGRPARRDYATDESIDP